MPWTFLLCFHCSSLGYLNLVHFQGTFFFSLVGLKWHLHWKLHVSSYYTPLPEFSFWKSSTLTCTYEPPHDKTNKMAWHPAKTGWSESSLSTWRKLGTLATHWAHSQDWSDWADAQADLSLCWAHMPLCWFCHEAAHIFLITGKVYSVASAEPISMQITHNPLDILFVKVFHIAFFKLLFSCVIICT